MRPLEEKSRKKGNTKNIKYRIKTDEKFCRNVLRNVEFF